MKNTKLFVLVVAVCLVISTLYRVLINKELLSDSYYRLIIALGCFAAWLVIVFIEKKKSTQQPK